MLATVQFYDVVVFVHITAMVLAFGPPFAYSVFQAVAEQTDPRALPAVGRAIHTWDRIAVWILLVLLGAGLYLTIDRWSFADFFVSWGLAAVVLLGGLVGGYFMPKTKQLIAIAERDLEASSREGGEPHLSKEFSSLSRQVGRVGSAAGLLVVLTIYVMVVKPFT